jgi:hypothetical protein
MHHHLVLAIHSMQPKKYMSHCTERGTVVQKPAQPFGRSPYEQARRARSTHLPRRKCPARRKGKLRPNTACLVEPLLSTGGVRNCIGSGGSIEGCERQLGHWRLELNCLYPPFHAARLVSGASKK